MSVADRSMGLGLKGLRALAGLEVIDRAGLRKPVERLIYEGSKNGFRAATTAGRTFSAATKLGKPGAAGHAVGAEAVRPGARRRAEDAPGGVRRLRRGEAAPDRPGRRHRLQGAGRGAGAGQRAGRRDAGRARGAGRRDDRALGRDVRAGGREAGPRRHGPGRRDPGPGRREHGDLAVGRRRPAGQVPAAVHRGRRARGRAGHPGAAGAVRPAGAGDRGHALARGLHAQRRPSRWCCAPPTPSCSWWPRGSRARAPRCSSSSPAPRACRSRPTRPWACAPRPPARWCWTT